MSWFLEMCDSNMHGDRIKIYIYKFKPFITSVHYRCVVLNINATWNVKLQDSQ
jgi:hypothetical protein